jgi:hypothetical protein
LGLFARKWGYFARIRGNTTRFVPSVLLLSPDLGARTFLSNGRDLVGFAAFPVLPLH